MCFAPAVLATSSARPASASSAPWSLLADSGGSRRRNYPMSAAGCVSRFVTTTRHRTRSRARTSSSLRRPTVGSSGTVETAERRVRHPSFGAERFELAGDHNVTCVIGPSLHRLRSPVTSPTPRSPHPRRSPRAGRSSPATVDPPSGRKSRGVQLPRRTAVHVRRRLFETFADRAVQALAENLALDHESLRPARDRPDDEEVGSAPSQTVLPFDSPAAVHDPLQERLQEKLRAGLEVVESRNPMLGMLAEEVLERARAASKRSRPPFSSRYQAASCTRPSWAA